MKLPQIQYLRAIAAIAVVIDHAAGMVAFDKYYGSAPPFQALLTKGALGVNLFFVISGFVIVISSYERDTLLRKKTVGEFMVARFIRIVPMMWLAIISYAALRLLGRGAFDPYPYLRASLLLPFGDYDPKRIWLILAGWTHGRRHRRKHSRPCRPLRTAETISKWGCHDDSPV